MINLDSVLRPWAEHAPNWSEADALRVIGELGAVVRDYDPGPERWIQFAIDGDWVGLVSVTHPLVLALRTLPAPAGVSVVTIPDYTKSERLSAAPGLLRATLLKDGWNDDFNPEHFSAHDLFFECLE